MLPKAVFVFHMMGKGGLSRGNRCDVQLLAVILRIFFLKSYWITTILLLLLLIWLVCSHKIP